MARSILFILYCPSREPLCSNQLHLRSQSRSFKDFLDMFVVEANTSVRRLAPDLPSILRSVDPVILPRQIERTGAQRIGGVSAWNKCWPFGVALTHRRRWRPARVLPFFDNLGIAPLCQLIGQGNRCRIDSHFAIGGPMLQHFRDRIRNDDTFVQGLEMVPPLVR